MRNGMKFFVGFFQFFINKPLGVVHLLRNAFRGNGGSEILWQFKQKIFFHRKFSRKEAGGLKS